MKQIDLSQPSDDESGAGIRDGERERWLIENCAALDAYNEHIETDGVFSDGLRSF